MNFFFENAALECEVGIYELKKFIHWNNSCRVNLKEGQQTAAVLQDVIGFGCVTYARIDSSVVKEVIQASPRLRLLSTCGVRNSFSHVFTCQVDVRLCGWPISQTIYI